MKLRRFGRNMDSVYAKDVSSIGVIKRAMGASTVPVQIISQATCLAFALLPEGLS
jgi:hypothetical protein